MQAEKSDLSERYIIGMPLKVVDPKDGLPVPDGCWHWEIVCESSGSLSVRVEGHIECRTLRLYAPLSAEDAKHLGIWLVSAARTTCPCPEAAVGKALAR